MNPFVLDFPPDNFDQIEFGGVGRQEIQMQSFPRPAFELLGHRLGRMDRGIVNDDHRHFLHRLGELVKKAGDLAGRHFPGAHLRTQLPFRQRVQPQHVDPRPVAAGQGHARPPVLPGVRDVGGAPEAAFVQVVQVDFAGGGGLDVFGKLLLALAELLLVAAVGQAGAHPLPDLPLPLEQPPDRVRADDLAKGRFNPPDRLVGAARVLLDPFHHLLFLVLAKAVLAPAALPFQYPVNPALRPLVQPARHRVPVEPRDRADLVNRVTPAAQQNGLRPLPDPARPVAILQRLQVHHLLFGKLWDKFDALHSFQ